MPWCIRPYSPTHTPSLLYPTNYPSDNTQRSFTGRQLHTRALSLSIPFSITEQVHPSSLLSPLFYKPLYLFKYTQTCFKPHSLRYLTCMAHITDIPIHKNNITLHEHLLWSCGAHYVFEGFGQYWFIGTSSTAARLFLPLRSVIYIPSHHQFVCRHPSPPSIIISISPGAVTLFTLSLMTRELLPFSPIPTFRDPWMSFRDFWFQVYAKNSGDLSHVIFMICTHT